MPGQQHRTTTPRTHRLLPSKMLMKIRILISQDHPSIKRKACISSLQPQTKALRLSDPWVVPFGRTPVYDTGYTLAIRAQELKELIGRA